jgi:hypothetical protein
VPVTNAKSVGPSMGLCRRAPRQNQLMSADEQRWAISVTLVTRRPGAMRGPSRSLRVLRHAVPRSTSSRPGSSSSRCELTARRDECHERIHPSRDRGVQGRQAVTGLALCSGNGMTEAPPRGLWDPYSDRSLNGCGRSVNPVSRATGSPVWLG